MDTQMYEDPKNARESCLVGLPNHHDDTSQPPPNCSSQVSQFGCWYLSRPPVFWTENMVILKQHHRCRRTSDLDLSKAIYSFADASITPPYLWRMDAQGRTGKKSSCYLIIIFIKELAIGLC
uniref:Uncharacterized protein n=1 Tax=Molossus molossus TaxID=27622 RepID=A0A7J8HZV7_MOLMO|nr:hypothetical protein HJG59_010800 [Molossus molossus]